MVSRLSQVHQTYLVGNLAGTNPEFLHRLSVMTHNFMTRLPEFSAMHKAGAVYYNQLITQARIFAYSDAFALFALIAFLMTPLALFLNVNIKK